jgi:hypothetical protein
LKSASTAFTSSTTSAGRPPPKTSSPQSKRTRRRTDESGADSARAAARKLASDLADFRTWGLKSPQWEDVTPRSFVAKATTGFDLMPFRKDLAARIVPKAEPTPRRPMINFMSVTTTIGPDCPDSLTGRYDRIEKEFKSQPKSSALSGRARRKQNDRVRRKKSDRHCRQIASGLCARCAQYGYKFGSCTDKNCSEQTTYRFTITWRRQKQRGIPFDAHADLDVAQREIERRRSVANKRYDRSLGYRSHCSSKARYKDKLDRESLRMHLV